LHDVTGQNPSGILLSFALTGTTSNYVTDARSNYFGLQSTLTDANCSNTLGGAVTADFNGDGSNDLIMIDWNGNTRMYTNDGKGNFSTSYTTPIPGGGTLEAADVDNDLDIDLLVASSNSVTVYANDGSGTFTAVTGNFFQGTGAANVTKVADLNGDGKKDLIVGNGGSGGTDSSLIYINTGTTGNVAYTYSRGLVPAPSRNSIDVGDLNGDGFMDIVTGGSSWASQVFFNNSNNGTFSMQVAPSGYSGGARLVDWNQDGKLDYMNYDQYNNYGLRYVLNDGSGLFTATPTLLLQDYNAHYAKLGDLNGDGFLDVVIDNWGGNAKAYLSNGCVLTLQNNCNYSLGRADNNVTLADYNGDGSLDIFCQARCNSSSVYMNYLTPVTGTPLPNVTITGNTLINYGATTILTAHGATNYQWNGNAGSATTASVSVSPTVPTNYVVVGTNSVGCSSSATVQVSIKGGALNFDGSNDYVYTSSPIVHNNQFTYEAWINAPTPNDWGGIMTTSSLASNQWVQFTLTNGGRLKVEVVDDAGNNKWYEGTTTLINDGNWHHVATTYDGNNNLSLFVDGILQSVFMQNDGTLGAITINASLFVGAERNLGPHFNGSIDEARVWNRALCQGEIINNMNGELHLPQTGLIAYYKFNEGIAGGNNASVTTLIDSSASALNGTLANFALTGTTSNWITPGGVMGGTYAPVYSAPTLTVSGTTTICSGQSTVLSASGADTYTWTSGPTASDYTVSPTGNATYSVNGTSLGCPTNMATVSVTVNPSPVITSQSGNVTVCDGSSGTFTVSSQDNTDTYQWYWLYTADTTVLTADNGAYTEVNYNTNSMTVNVLDAGNWGPSGAQAVTSIITGTNGCTTQSRIDTIFINALPIVQATITTPTLCLGFADTVIASGASTYTWSSNAASTVNDTAIVNPSANDTYTVMGTDVNGCMNTATISVVVNNCGTGINAQTTTWSVYPNPSSGNFTLRSDSEIGNVEVRNALGALVYKTVVTGTSVEINLSSEAAGIYYLNAQGKKMMLSKQ
jgi:hypothetical protein